MNRIKISPLAIASSNLQTHESQSASLDQFEKAASRCAEDCSVFVPMHYESGYSYPLIVWLHDNGDDTQQLQRVMPYASLRNYVGIGPQGSVGDAHRGYYWQHDSVGIECAHESVMNAIDHASLRFNIDQKRIFIAGFGGGGEMAFRVAFERPDLFAGVISINGQVPSGDSPLAGLSDCRELPVFWAHCRQSVEFLQEELCEQLKLLYVAGFAVTLRQYPALDQLSSLTLSDMNDWIMDTLGSRVGSNIIR